MKEKLGIEKKVLELVLSENYQPLKPRAIAKKLDLADEEREIKRTIKRLVKQGRLSYGAKHLICKPESGTPKKRKSSSSTSDKSKKVVGLFRRATAGFGFVKLQNATVADKDIFIPKQKTLDAADQDVVRIKIDSERRDQPGKGKRKSSLGPSGRIVEVIDRHTHRFVGTYQTRDEYGFVAVDGNVFDSAILVGDASAKNGREGDKVVIEMVHFPSNRHAGEGVIVEILGERGQPGVDTLTIIRQFDLPDEFPESVLEDARQQAELFDDQIIPENRRDFTQTTVVTIDPKTARDFDDAISLERYDNGHWLLGVHIADVSHFVPTASDLDREAFDRATSVYLPDRVIPMLPEIISNNLASLQPDRCRYCMTAEIEFTADGIPVSTELHRGVIKSAHRFNYEEIDDYLANDKPWKKKLTKPVFDIVRNMHTLAMKLRQRRMKGGAINLVLPEIKIDLDDDGKVSGAHTVENTESHQLIEEFMLAANIAVAQELIDRDLFLMRRIHPQPTESKLEDLTNFVQGLGIECENLQDRHEMKQVIEASEGMPEQHAIHYAVLRSMQKAIYSPEDIGHYALNTKAYCHFTSPIRRYPDLIIHRMVGDLVDGKRPDANFDRLLASGTHCSEREKRAATAERDLTKLKLLNFMSDRVGETLHAVITGVESFGIFVQGIEIPAEGLIPVANLPRDTYRFDRPTRTLSGHQEKNQFRLGDRCTVKVAMVDPDQRLLEFVLTDSEPAKKTPRKKHSKKAAVDTQKVKNTSSKHKKAAKTKKQVTQKKVSPKKQVRKKSGSKNPKGRRK